MEESHVQISSDLRDKLELISEFRQSYADLKDECRVLKEENNSLKAVMNIAENSEKSLEVFRSYATSFISKQNIIIGNFVNIKEDNWNLKKELNTKNEMIVNLHKELDEIREKMAEEMKSAQDIHEEELVNFRAQYLFEEKKIKEEFEDERQKMIQTVHTLKEDIDLLNSEKEILVATTVREYEEHLQTLRNELNNSKKELKEIQDKYEETVNFYNKKLEDQEKHYVIMLEKIQCKMSSDGASVAQNDKQKCDLSEPSKNSLKIASSARSSFSTHQKQAQHQEKPSNLLNVSRKVHSNSSLQQSLAAERGSEFYENNRRPVKLPVKLNTSYYERLNLPPRPQPPIPVLSSLNHQSSISKTSVDDNDFNCNLNKSEKTKNNSPKRFDISLCNNFTYSKKFYENAELVDDHVDNFNDSNKYSVSINDFEEIKYPVSKKKKIMPLPKN